ncbi:MAG: LuxR family transcriptional regulator, partial [Pseudomonadota bacterium]
MQFLSRFNEPFYAAFRIVLGFLFLFHGTQKLLDFPLAYPYGPLSNLATAAGIIELVGGTLV